MEEKKNAFSPKKRWRKPTSAQNEAKKQLPPSTEQKQPQKKKRQPQKPIQLNQRQNKKPMELNQKQNKKPMGQVQKKRPMTNKRPQPSVKIISLGGLNEIGKNITLFECGNDIIIVDCGIAFPDDDMLGVDLVIPDFTYIYNNIEKVRGLFITHGHEDHIGSVPYLLKNCNIPIFGTKLSLGIIENKLAEHKLQNVKLKTVSAGDKVSAGCFSVEFIRVNHSIADACALAITTPQGVILHTGDFKLDTTPIESEMMDVTRLGTLGNSGVRLLLCESTNVERPGYTPSERNVGITLDKIFSDAPDKRLVIATFASNVHRVQQIINSSIKYGRKVAIAGRSMVNVISAAVSLGYMNVPEEVLIDIDSIKKYPPEKTTIITTGSQGEPMSALYRMAFSDHDKIQLTDKDLVVLSSSAIPGNEKLVGKIINELYRRGVNVYHDTSVEVHVSGHACQEELKLMHALTKPEYFMPIHGEYRHLIRHKELAEHIGMSADRIFVSDIGKVLELSDKGMKFNGVVPSGKVLIDGGGVSDVGNIVLRDRKNLAESGLIIAVATVNLELREIVSGPEIVSRGFVYVRESEELVSGAKETAQSALESALNQGICDWAELKNIMKNAIARYVFSKTKRKPIILPILMNL